MQGEVERKRESERECGGRMCNNNCGGEIVTVVVVEVREELLALIWNRLTASGWVACV